MDGWDRLGPKGLDYLGVNFFTMTPPEIGKRLHYPYADIWTTDDDSGPKANGSGGKTERVCPASGKRLARCGGSNCSTVLADSGRTLSAVWVERKECERAKSGRERQLLQGVSACVCVHWEKSNKLALISTKCGVKITLREEWSYYFSIDLEKVVIKGYCLILLRAFNTTY